MATLMSYISIQFNMYESLKNKRILITGASAGIGSAIAEHLAGFGACVGIHYRQNKKGAQDILDKIKHLPGKAALFEGDLLLESVRNNLISDFIGVFGGIDGLVNNAGGTFGYQHFSVLDEQSWDNAYCLNTKAPFILTRKAFQYMKSHGGGRIINITTVAVKYVGPKSMHYTSSKAALDTLTIGFAREGAKHNILVNSIRCGVIDTPMHTKIDGYKEDDFQKRARLIPLQRLGTPADIARMASFLMSECGDFITGEFFAVAGGD